MAASPSDPQQVAPARFATLFPLGRGGMGAVEVAVDRGDPAAPEADEARGPRVVALKRLLADVARDRRNVEAFLREARLASLLMHPNVVRAHWAGEDAGEVVLAMEYVEGEPLSDVLEALAPRGLDPALAAWVVAAVCEGLHAAHELRDVGGDPLNLVHRDVSPHNVMVGYDGRVVVLDFGVAKVDAGVGLTKTGEVKGKTAYMSPEQGLGEPLDRRSDLFSVGAVLFECVAGRRMWTGTTEMQVLKQLALESPPRLADVRPETPPAIAELAHRLVARAPSDRPATAREVADALRAAADGVSRSDVSALMTDLFADRAQDKRERLMSALEGRDRDEVEALRASLAHPPPAPSASVAPSASSTGGRSRARWVLPALGVVAVALGLVEAVGWVGARTPTPTLTPTQAPTPTLTLTPTPTLTATPTLTLTPTSTLALAPTPTLTATPTLALTPTLAQTGARTSTLGSVGPRATARASASAAPSSSTPDVDPHPF